MNKAKLLVEILLDKNAYEADREDALIDLGKNDDKFIEDALTNLGKNDDKFIEDALITLIGDDDDDHDLRNDACENLVQYWINRDSFNKDKICNIPKYYQKKIYLLVSGLRPEWMPEFKEFEPLDPPT